MPPQLSKDLLSFLALVPQLHSLPTRRLSASCDSTFLQCLLSPPCRTCFATLQANSVDWTNVVPDTPCQDVLSLLAGGGHCLTVRNGGNAEQELFCSAFDACIVWDDTAVPTEKSVDAASFLDCSTLTDCQWEGMHAHFLGDGVCHDALPGCYNSKVCKYDGGDCCEDTCVYPVGPLAAAVDIYGHCGQEGYACRDPQSDKCQPALARMYQDVCKKEIQMKNSTGQSEIQEIFDDDSIYAGQPQVLPECTSTQSIYRLVQFDSWGDGWDNTVLTLTERDALATAAPLYKGGLKYGSQGTEYLCLSKNEPKCYHVQVENGIWGNEISWEIRPLSGGAPLLAAGGSPSDCTLPLGGTLANCDNTCDKSRPETNIKDPNYKSYKDMEACLEKKCVIQAGTCLQDASCINCMTENTPEYCFANDNFNALIDCSMCSCTEPRPAYCDSKSSSMSSNSIGGSSAATHDGIVKPATGTATGAATAGTATGGTALCGPEQTLKGTQSLIKFADCANIDQMMAMITEFDNDNFGMLDLFEDCAHAYEKDPLHGGKSALECMKILHNIIIDENDADATSAAGAKKGANGENLSEKVSQAVSTLAHHLYDDAEAFCECSTTVNKETPTCSSFINFKTLLYEAVDACKALDAIDCAAWEEFYTPCKKNLIQMFNSINFENTEQCSYVEKMCGGAGPFPAFRRLDCGGEISKSAWDFHTIYSRGCLKSIPETPVTPSIPSGAIPVPHGPAPVPNSSPSSSSGAKRIEPWKPSTADAPRPYYSPNSANTEPEAPKSYSPHKSSRHFLSFLVILMILCGAGYIYRKRQNQNFNYYRFRQMRQSRNYGGHLNDDNGGEYSGLSLADSCSFEPPSLPPTPSGLH